MWTSALEMSYLFVDSSSVRNRPVPHLAFEGSAPRPNVLRLEMEPDRLALSININGPGDPFDLEAVELETQLAPQDLPRMPGCCSRC